MSGNARHTPGPWQVYRVNDNTRVVDTRGNVVTEWAQNNATLIAAAPDLLEDCKAVLRMSVVCPEDIAVEVELCRAAVAKADNR